jgi:hypothetical protein
MTQTPPVGDGAPKDSPECSLEHGPGDGSASDRPTNDELLRHLGAAVLLCWNDLSFSSQVKILAQTNAVIGTRPIPEARNEFVKLLLRHTKR